MKKICMIVLLLLCAKQACGQCSGYSSDPAKGPAVLTPGEAAAQGAITGTINADGSHKETITGGTLVHLAWSNGNAVSVKVTVAENGQNPAVWSNALSASDSQWSAWGPGNVFTWTITATDANGNTSQDRAYTTVVSGTAGTTVSADLQVNNYYAVMTSSFKGPSMADACTLCQNQPYKCINKMHHPRQHWQVTNSTTTEYHDAGWVYGNPACETCAVSYSGSSPFISFLPGDALTFNVENTVICDEFGVIYDNNGGDTFNIQTEYAFTTSATLGSMCKLIPEPNGGHAIECPIRYFCKKGSAPPDFNPAYLASDRNCATPGFCTEADIPVFPPYWLLGGAGVRFTINGGGVWQFPFADAEGFVVGVRKKSDFINLLFNIADAALPSPFGANAITCTNYDLGTSPFSVWP